MEEKTIYSAIKACDFDKEDLYLGPPEKMTITTGTLKTSEIKEESQLDRIEKKMDRILELLENGNLSISLDGKSLAKEVMKEIDFIQRTVTRSRRQ